MSYPRLASGLGNIRPPTRQTHALDFGCDCDRCHSAYVRRAVIIRTAHRQEARRIMATAPRFGR